MNDVPFKLLALYLPQFHQTPENDRWWSEGFTEWNNVRAARRTCACDIQPRVPLCGYYDLSDVNALREQARLANEYGVDGFVIYSYYFRGERLLERPLQLLYEHPDIPIQYCLSWANHDWSRVWNSYDRTILRKLEYARNDREIREHFEYCLPFFRDPRYLRWNGCPLFFLYDPKGIPNLPQYRKIWNDLARRNGFNGICFVQTLGEETTRFDSEQFDAAFCFEPFYSAFHYQKLRCLWNWIRRGLKKITGGSFLATTFSYPALCKCMSSFVSPDPRIFPGMTAEWNNTPRHQTNGTILTGFTISAFRKTLLTQLREIKRLQKPFLIINAWNEWGEGAFLEPDAYFRYEKLEAVRDCVSDVFYSDRGKYWWNDDHLRAVLEKTWKDFRETASNSERLAALLQGLEPEDQRTIQTALARVARILDSEEPQLDLFTLREKKQMAEIERILTDQIQPSGDGFAWRSYWLPLDCFEPGIFLDRLGMDLLKKPERLAGSVFLDIGAFIGDSALILREYDPARIVCFEPVQESLEALEKTIAMNGMRNVRTERLALGDREADMNIRISGSASSFLDRAIFDLEGTETAHVTTLDYYVRRTGCERIGLIKIDVEGMEIPCLLGARETILRDQPVLLISIYHSSRDFFEIKAMLERWNCGYQFRIHKPVSQMAVTEMLLIAEPR